MKTGGRDPKRLAIGDKVPEIFVKVFLFIHCFGIYLNIYELDLVLGFYFFDDF